MQVDSDLQFRVHNKLSRVGWDIGKVVDILAPHESVPPFSVNVCVDFPPVQRVRWPGTRWPLIPFVERSNLEFVVRYPGEVTRKIEISQPFDVLREGYDILKDMTQAAH